MSIILTILLSFSLSMDAFSMALMYGTLNLNQKICHLVSVCVGLFHFLMPIIGCSIGQIIVKIISVNTNIIVGIIFILIGFDMLLSMRKKNNISILNSLLSYLLFSFTVSIDSFSVGVSYGINNRSIIFACIIFSCFSYLFTFIGLMIGKKLNNILGSVSTIIGAIILILLGIKYLI